MFQRRICIPTHNKIVLAATMFTEAHARYVEAAGNIDYVTSILLSGAVMGIVSPLFKEQCGHTSHELLARIERHFAEPDTAGMAVSPPPVSRVFAPPVS